MKKEHNSILKKYSELYEQIFDLSPVSIIIVDADGQIVDVNPYHINKVCRGKTTKEEYLKKTVFNHLTSNDAGLKSKYRNLLSGKSLDEKHVYFPQTPGGMPGFFNIKAFPVFNGETILGAVLIYENITEYNVYKRKLEEANDALKVLSKQATTAKQEMEEKISDNIKILVMPYVDELKSRLKDTAELSYLDELTENIETITSSFLKNIRSEYLHLTPREIQVANLIRQGKTNKDIAYSLALSIRTVEFYRANLRKKFNLSNRKISLRSYLLLKS